MSTIQALHERLIGGDDEARDRLCDVLIPVIAARLSRRWLRTDGDLILTAVHDACLWYFNHPKSILRQTGAVEGLLVHVAHRRLQDAWRVRRRWDARHSSIDDVPPRLSSSRGAEEYRPIAGNIAMLDRLLEVCRDDDERAVIKAVTKGASETDFAVHLGLTGQSALTVQAAVRRLVKRLRSRVKYRSRQRTGRAVPRLVT